MFVRVFVRVFVFVFVRVFVRVFLRVFVCWFVFGCWFVFAFACRFVTALFQILIFDIISTKRAPDVAVYRGLQTRTETLLPSL